ncbi:hypothetical protein F4818DRAFT_405366 [Hypoxylon cercidicola]|nr:hypothetical protein F4818DRAFT_405366 [Hypoxylon cercidicola]
MRLLVALPRVLAGTVATLVPLTPPVGRCLTALEVAEVTDLPQKEAIEPASTHAPSHSKAECPNPRVLKCRHCNEDGHLIRDCPTAPPQEFTGECRYCHKEGHMAKDCPDKPPMVCKNCQEEGESHIPLMALGPQATRNTNLQQATPLPNARVLARSTAPTSPRSAPSLPGPNSSQQSR